MARAARKMEIIRQIADDTGLPIKEVVEAVDSQFKYVVEIMKNDTFDQVRLPFFGRFWVKPGRLKFLSKFGKRLPHSSDDDQ